MSRAGLPAEDWKGKRKEANKWPSARARRRQAERQAKIIVRRLEALSKQRNPGGAT